MKNNISQCTHTINKFIVRLCDRKTIRESERAAPLIHKTAILIHSHSKSVLEKK